MDSITFLKQREISALISKPVLENRNGYLDLIHVQDSPGGSLGAQAVADALIQSHAIELAVVRRPPPENTGTGNKICDKDQRAQMPPNTAR